jgi:putative FmdB family regulatory protein
MPIYEFYCPDCHTVFSFFSSRIDTTVRPACPQCGKLELARKPSRFAALSKAKSGAGGGGPDNDENDADDPLAGLDEERMAGVMDSLAAEMEGMDDSAQQDPKQLARFLTRFQEATGLEAGPKMEEMMARLKEGADMDELEAQMGGAGGASPEGEGGGFEGGEGGGEPDDFSDFFRAKRAAAARRKAPRVDETLHFL